MKVARHDLDPRVGDADQRTGKIFIRETNGFQHGSGRRPAGADEQIVTLELYIFRHGIPFHAAQNAFVLTRPRAHSFSPTRPTDCFAIDCPGRALSQSHPPTHRGAETPRLPRSHPPTHRGAETPRLPRSHPPDPSRRRDAAFS